MEFAIEAVLRNVGIVNATRQGTCDFVRSAVNLRARESVPREQADMVDVSR